LPASQHGRRDLGLDAEFQVALAILLSTASLSSGRWKHSCWGLARTLLLLAEAVRGECSKLRMNLGSRLLEGGSSILQVSLSC